MKHRIFRYVFLAALVFAATTFAGLWSWNTVIELFDGPRAGYRHVIAALTLAVLLRCILVPRRLRFRGWRRTGMEHSS